MTPSRNTELALQSASHSCAYNGFKRHVWAFWFCGGDLGHYPQTHNSRHGGRAG